MPTHAQTAQAFHAKMHPALLAAVTQQPDALVQIIVQTRMQVGSTATLVEQFDGTVTKSLHIINAVAAQMRAADAERLARHHSVSWLTLDAPVTSSGLGGGLIGGLVGGLLGGSAGSSPTNSYLETLGVQKVWNRGIRGNGIGVAVIDSGIEPGLDLRDRNGVSKIKEHKYFGLGVVALGQDSTGHGTHIGGIIAGNGANSNGLFKGIAPGAHLLSLRVSSATGVSLESDAVAAMQWVLDHKAQYNIRVVNLSINSGSESSYHNSPLAAAAEVLWFHQIVVVVSSGNNDPLGLANTANAAPANDPFVITVGASDESGTSARGDDFIPDYSAAALTQDGFSKPEIIAPGSNIISVLAKQGLWHVTKLDRVVNRDYLRLSGTSMSAPMVAAAAALLLQSEPNLTPDQVKYRLINAADSIQAADGTTYPYLNIYKAYKNRTKQSANTGLEISQLLWPALLDLQSGSVNWNSVNWNSVNWNSVNWNSVNWNSADWGIIEWNSVFFVEDVAELLNGVVDLVTEDLPLLGGNLLGINGAAVPDKGTQTERIYLPMIVR